MSQKDPISKPTNVRWYGGFLVLLLCFVAYLDRANFSVNASPIMKAIHISPIQFGVMTTVFSVGYFIFQIPGSLLVERYGSRSILTFSLILWSIFTFFTGAAGTFVSLAIVRFFFGVGEAPLFPSGNHFFANWFTKKERGRANSLMNGGSFLSNIVGPPIIVAVAVALGWRWTFYLAGILGLVVAVLWFIQMRSRPEQHARVNSEELALIRNDGVEQGDGQKKIAPWGLFLRQRSFWMIALGYFSTLWVVQFFIYWLPYYLQASRHLSFKSMGFYTSIPWISITIAVFFAGTVSDALMKRGWSKYKSRNLISIVGLLISGISLVISTTTTSAISDIVWISIALGTAGFSQTLAWAIATDLGGQFTSTVGGWMNTWGFIAASIVPTVAPIVARDLGWNAAILLNAAITILGVIGYALVQTNQPLKHTTAKPESVTPSDITA
ncbi:MFS transporter [Alicyclobacillus dauci]|uniref:MFS transporter n=1 Tax=Alicyclobacillus dauci TaxID=1475485 RepID=A0ABY6Z430_9BACL|nr:MFS transporter [Alicyclobacillus dauci]WAH37632.1 MFS transporter [Alicyclobacillus dauci]